MGPEAVALTSLARRFRAGGSASIARLHSAQIHAMAMASVLMVAAYAIPATVEVHAINLSVLPTAQGMDHACAGSANVFMGTLAETVPGS